MAWQPFGPGENINLITTLGSHYRGFPVVPICDHHHDLIHKGEPFPFTYRGAGYVFDGAGVL
jgi:hypothetical protein